MNEELMKRVARLAKRYRTEILRRSHPQPEALCTHWWKAYSFLAGKIFYQGRSDSLSTIIRNMATTILIEHFDTQSPDGLVHATDKDIINARIAFESMKVNGKSYKRKNDIDMLFGVVGRNGELKKQGIIHFLLSLPKGNIVEHSIREVEEGRVAQLYNELDSIHSIGHKIASFYLRDLVDLFYDRLGKCKHIRSKEAQAFLQPVDVWVKKVSEACGVTFDKSDPLHQAKCIVDACREVSRSRRFAISFNQGAWYLGAHSLDIALKELSKI